MSVENRPPLVQYGIPVVAVAIAVGMFLLMQMEGFPLLLAAVAFAAWFGGLRPGLLATGSSVFVIISSVLISQKGQFAHAGDLQRMVLFTLLSFLIGSLTAAYQSAQRRAQAATQDWRTSEKRYRRIVETANEGIWTLDAEGRTSYVNPRLGEMLGYEPEEMLNRPLIDFMAATLGEENGSAAKIEPNEQNGPFDARFRRRDGSELRAIVSATGITDEKGDYLGSLAMVMDISERYRIELELKQQRDFMTAVLDTAGCLVVVHDQLGRIVRFNKSCEELTGYSFADVEGRTPWEFLTRSEDAAEVRARFTRTADERFEAKYESDWVTRSGRIRRIAWSNTTLRDAQGTIDYIIATGIDITERRQAEEALRQSEERYALAVRGSSDGLWDWNILTNETYVSPRFRELIGLQSFEGGDVSATLEARLHEEDRERVLQALQDHLERQVPYDVEYRLRGEQGEYRWFHSRGQAIWDSSGRATRMAGSVRDITERKRSEGALRASEERYRLLFERNLAGVLRATEDGRVLDCNESYARILGYGSREEILARSASDFYFSAGDRDSLLERLHKEQVVSNYEMRIRRKDGAFGWVLANIVWFEDKDGQAVIQTTTVDITERKRAEEAVRQSEARLQAVLDNSRAVVYLKDAKGRFLLVNRWFETLFRVSRDQVIGKTAHDVFPGDLADQIEANDRRLLDAEAPLELEETYTHAGRRRTYLAIKAPIRDSAGRMFGLCTVSTDITERKRAEEALRSSEERYRLLYERNMAGVLRTTVDGRILDSNGTFARILGYTSGDELKNRTMHELYFEPADRDALLVRLRSEPILSNFELCLKRKDGSPCWVLANIMRIEPEGKGAGMIQGTVVDISEWKRAERALRESESVLRSFYESAAMAMGVFEVVDDDVKCLSANATAAKYLGLPSDSSPSRFSGRAGLPRQRLHLFLEKYRESERAGKPVRFEYASTLPGSPAWVAVTICPIAKSPAGRPRFSIIAEDNTERKWAEQLLRDSEEQHRLLFESNPQPMWVYDTETLAFLAVNEAAVEHYGYARDEFLAMTVTQLCPPEDLAVADAQYSSPKLFETPVSGAVTHRRQDGTVIDVELSSGTLTFAGRPARVVLANDVTVRTRAEDALRRRNRELVTINAIAAVINSSLRLPEVLSSLKRLLNEKLGIAGGGIFLYDESDRRLYLHTGWGLPLALLAEIDQMLNSDVQDGRSSWKGRAIFRPGVHQGSPFVAAMQETNRPEWENCLCVPFDAKGDVRGVLLLFNPMSTQFSEDQADFYVVLGQQVGVAIQNARLFDQVRASRKRLKALSQRLVEVQEAERRAIARELHDEIGQVLTGLKLSLEMTARLPAEKRASASLEEPQTLVNRLMGRVRAMSLDLRPTMLDDLGLIPALVWHFERYTTQTGIRVSFEHVNVDRRFPSDVETAAYRIVQEALTNVARYAKVNEVTMRLWANQDALGLQVEDHGVGFDSVRAIGARASSGLSGMQERAFLLGGRLTIDSTPGAGTSLSAELPLGAMPKKKRKRKKARRS